MATETGLRTAATYRRCSLDHHDNHLHNFELQVALPATSDDSGDDDATDDPSQGVDQRGVIGVSISSAQRYLASPKTPAAVKAAALYQGIDARLDGAKEDKILEQQTSDLSLATNLQPSVQTGFEAQSESLSPLELASSWRIGPKLFEVSSPPSHDRKTANITRKYLPFHFPNLPLNPFSNKPTPPKLAEKVATSKVQVNESVNVISTNALQDKPDLNLGTMNHSISSMTLGQADHTQLQQARLPLLRRSTSESQFFVERQLSLVPTLGDDSRWENVNEQINSRVRALKDSWHDSNFKMPNFKSFPHLNFGAPWAEAPDHEKLNRHRKSADFTSRDNLYRRNTSLHVDAAELTLPREGNIIPTRRMTKLGGTTHPEFENAIENLIGDIVILGGYRGSTLRSAKPPQPQLWVPLKVGLNLRKVNLGLGLYPEDEANSEDLIIPSGMLKNIGPVDISKRLFKRLRSSANAREGLVRVWDYGYDWRLSPHLLSRQLIEVLEDLPCNSPGMSEGRRGATVIAHSLGGLITRHAVNSRPDLFAGVVYAGVPQSCVNILGPLRNGDDVMLSSRVLTAQVNFTIRTTFALLPLDGKCFVDLDTKEPYPVDFFDVKHWEEYAFSPCISRSLPPLQMSPPSGLINRAIGTVGFALPGNSRRTSTKPGTATSGTATPTRPEGSSSDTSSLPKSQMQTSMTPQMMGKVNPQQLGQSEELNVSTAVTLPRDACIEYLTRTLSEVKKFKSELAYRPENQSKYPPTAVIFGKSLPTVDGCKVKGRNGIKHADAYDNLTFASGDGVVLAKAAQIPEGYRVARGGLVSSDRGHISLLGDLEAVGKCLNAILAERERRGRRKSDGKMPF